MVAEIFIYIEGGGDQNTTKTALRQGYSGFFKDIISLVRNKRIHWRIVSCGSRRNAYNDFTNALKSHPSALNVLLIDSESQVHCSPWEHLRVLESWSRPRAALDDNVHFMAQCMESWIIADVDSLETYYGSGFQRSKIPLNTNVENVPKGDVLESLFQATERTSKGGYHKTQHGFALLGRIRPDVVITKASYCGRLFQILESFIRRH